ncbi:hypothetical protein OB905_13435 [Halobacteria archaeon AArc-dxtr1]|nr:hypothetical protein [Halobacteria archaeon AArc-dxtr1]
MNPISRDLALARENPAAAALNFATAGCCLLLFAGTIALLATGLPTGTGQPWLAVIALGALVALLWTVLVPLYQRWR